MQKVGSLCPAGSTKNGAHPYDLLGTLVSLNTTHTANLLEKLLSVIVRLGPLPSNSKVGVPGTDPSNVVAIS